jgi:SnoaL-like domain
MQSYLEDRLSIADLMTGWIHRDLGEWDQLRNLFHPDATIEVSWFAGKASDFVDGSMKMGASDVKTKHVITSPVVTFNGDKAIAETNAIVVGDHAVLGVGCEGHIRFYDCVDKRDGVWKIVDRQAIYDTACLPSQLARRTEISARVRTPLPTFWRKAVFPVNRVYPTKGSDLEKTIKAKGATWLKA